MTVLEVVLVLVGAIVGFLTGEFLWDRYIWAPGAIVTLFFLCLLAIILHFTGVL